MIQALALSATIGVAATAAVAVDVPSGQPVELYEVLVDHVGMETWLRFRFLAPEISRSVGTVDYFAAEADFAVLCSDVALPYIAEHALDGDMVVITLLDRPVDFGQTDPDATQFIDAFRPNNGICIWEAL